MCHDHRYLCFLQYINPFQENRSGSLVLLFKSSALPIWRASDACASKNIDIDILILLKKAELVHWRFCLNLVPFQFGHRMIQSTQPKANTQKFNPNVINCIIWTTFANFLLYSCGTFQIATNQTIYPEIITL